MRYPPLLVAVFITLLFKAFEQPGAAPALPRGFLLLMVILALIYAFRHIWKRAVLLAILGTGAVSSQFLTNYLQLPMLELASQGLILVMVVLTMVAILSEVLRARVVPTDLVIGAVCLYLILGLAWTFLYYSMYLLSPASIFSSPSPEILTAAVTEAKFTELLYFSFGALTTIGSAGADAVTLTARRLAVVESAMAQLYLAVLISRLVGFTTASHTTMATVASD